MTPTQRRSDRKSLFGVGAVLGACAVCCAGPLLAVLGGIGILATAAAVWVPALLALAVAAAAGMVWVLRRRQASGCATMPGPAEIGMPSPARRRRPALR